MTRRIFDRAVDSAIASRDVGRSKNFASAAKLWCTHCLTVTWDVPCRLIACPCTSASSFTWAGDP